MNKSRQRIGILIGSFFIVFVVSIVFALATGTLTFSGTAQFTDIVDVQFLDDYHETNKPSGYTPTINGKRQSESLAVISGETLQFVVELQSPSDSRTINFKLHNYGNVDVELDQLNISAPASVLITGTAITSPSLDGLILTKGSSSGEYTLIVTWNPAYEQADGTELITISIDYAQVIGD
jgi:hypothetical protein